MAVTAPAWFALQQRCDAIVDQQWSEPLEIHPWVGGTVSEPGQADPSRPVIKTVGIYVSPGAQVVGEISTGAAGTDSKQLENEVWASVQREYIGNYETTYKANDRLFWVWRNEWFTVDYIGPSSTYRPNIHLLRLNENALLSSHEYTAHRLEGKKIMTLAYKINGNGPVRLVDQRDQRDPVMQSKRQRLLPPQRVQITNPKIKL